MDVEIIELSKANPDLPEDWYKDVNHGAHVHTIEDRDYTFYLRIREEGKTVALMIASIYEFGTMYRCNQWTFSFNKDRLLWIDWIWAKKKRCGYGSKLMTFFEDYIKKRISEGLVIQGKQNIYVISVDKAVVFYLKHDYIPIYIKPKESEELSDDHEYCEDCEAPTFWMEVGKWMAKPLYEKLDREEPDYDRDLKTKKDIDYVAQCYDFEALEKKFATKQWVDEYLTEEILAYRDRDEPYFEMQIRGLKNPFEFGVDDYVLASITALILEHHYGESCAWLKEKKSV